RRHRRFGEKAMKEKKMNYRDTKTQRGDGITTKTQRGRAATEATPSPASDGREGWGEETRWFLWSAPLHEPNPLTPSLSPTGGEGARRAGEGDSAWFMVPMRGRRTVEALHEPKSGFVDFQRLAQIRFMVPMRPRKRMEAFHKPQRAAGILPAEKLGSADPASVAEILRRVDETSAPRCPGRTHASARHKKNGVEVFRKLFNQCGGSQMPIGLACVLLWVSIGPMKPLSRPIRL